MEIIKIIRAAENSLVEILIIYINELFSKILTTKKRIENIELIALDIGKLGFDFSIYHQAYYLIIIYDAKVDSFFIIYHNQNEIVNNFEAKISIDENKLNPVLAKFLKEESVKDFRLNQPNVVSVVDSEFVNDSLETVNIPPYFNENKNIKLDFLQNYIEQIEKDNVCEEDYQDFRKMFWLFYTDDYIGLFRVFAGMTMNKDKYLPIAKQYVDLLKTHSFEETIKIIYNS